MQPAKTQDLIAEQGSTFDQLVVVLDGNGNPVNFTAKTYGFRGHVRKKYSDASPTLTFTIYETDLENGKITLHLSAEDLSEVAKGDYVYDIECYFTTTTPVTEVIVYKLIKGTFTVLPEVTKA